MRWVLATAALGCAASAPAQTKSGWKGTGVNNNWSNPANWDNGVPNDSGTNVRDLYFGAAYNTAGGTLTTANNDLSVHGFRITFEATSPVNDHSFTLTGNAYSLFDFSGNFPKIENLSTVTQTVNMAITLTGTNGGQKAETNPVNGNLIFGSSVDLGGTTQLQIFGSNGKTVTFSGAITSSGNSGLNSLLMPGTSSSNVLFSNSVANSYLGATTVNGGTLLLNSTASNGAIANSSLVIGDGSGTDTAQFLRDTQINNSASITVNSSGVLDFNGHSDIVGSITVNAGAVTLGAGSVSMGLLTMTGGNVSAAGNGQLVLGNSPLLSNSADGSTPATISGALSLGGANRTFTVNHNAGASTVDADISANVVDSTGTHGLTKTGSGTLRLSGSNSYLGNTSINAGTLSISADNNLGAVPSGLITNAIQFTGTTPALRATATFSLDANRGITLTTTGIIDATGGNLTIGGPIVGNTNRLTITGSGIITLNGGLTSTADLLKQGSGTVRLTTANNFGAANNLFVDKGNVEVSANGGLGNTNGTTTGLLNLGASNGAAAGDVSLLITAAGITVANPIDSRFFTGISSGKTIGGTNSSGVAAFTGGVTLHDNTALTAAAGGTVALSGPITTGTASGGQSVNSSPPTGGFNTGPGIIVTGGGIVELSGNNSYTGDSVVDAGTLQFNGGFANASTIRLGDSSGAAAAAINIANSAGATFGQVINVRPGSAGAKTISASNVSGTTIFSNHLALDANATLISTNAGATLAVTQARSTPADTTTGFDLKGFTATVAGAGNTTLSGTVYNSVNNGSILKQGAGNLTLSGSNTYSGNTTIQSGKLLVSNTAGSATGSGNVSIGSLGLLGGTGTISGDTTVASGGQVSPGDFGSAGELTAGNFTLSSGATLQVEVGGDPNKPGVNFDQLAISGGGKVFTVGGANLSVIPLGSVLLHVPYRIVDASANIVVSTAKFANLDANDGYNDGGTRYTVSYNASSIDVTFDAVPEPGMIGLLAGAMLVGRRRGRRGISKLAVIPDRCVIQNRRVMTCVQSIPV